VPPLDPIAALFLVVVGLFLPIACIRSAIRVSRGTPLPPFRATRLSTLIVLGSLTAFALWVARHVGMPLFPPPRFDLTLTIITAAVVVALLIGGVIHWRLRPAASRAGLVALLPRTPGDFVWWAAVCAMAGIGEEIIYRGVLYGILEHLTGSWLAATLLAAAVFGVSHAIQGWSAGAVTFTMALLVQWLVYCSGDLYLAMAAHFTYDMAAGFVYSWLARKAGLFTEPEPPAPPAAAAGP